MSLVQIGQKKPDWLKVRLPGGERYESVRDTLRGLRLHTVCEEARCPNVAECWGGGTATVMLLGEVCSRSCRFCHVRSGNPGGVVDAEEPFRVAEALSRMGLEYVVLTSVDRDDLPDQGSGVFARTVELLRQMASETRVEVLIPDFRGEREALDRVIRSSPDVIAHNLETVRRLTPAVRDARATYDQSLEVLRYVRERGGVLTKSSLMLGLGEGDDEIEAAIGDLRAVGTDILTFGQYLRPSAWHLPVAEYVTPEKFGHWERRARAAGFLYCASGPLVRSSYRAGELFLRGLIDQKKSAERT